MITQASVFPKGKRDDMVDSTTMSLSYLRSVSVAQSNEEVRAEENEHVVPRLMTSLSQTMSLYACRLRCLTICANVESVTDDRDQCLSCH